MSDLIERQAAIDAIDKAFERSNPLNGYIRAFMVTTISEVRKLPSAQPELIRCKDCKYWEGEERNGFYYFEHCSQTGMDALCDDFCGRAERREDG